MSHKQEKPNRKESSFNLENRGMTDDGQIITDSSVVATEIDSPTMTDLAEGKKSTLHFVGADALDSPEKRESLDKNKQIKEDINNSLNEALITKEERTEMNEKNSQEMDRVRENIKKLSEEHGPSSTDLEEQDTRLGNNVRTLNKFDPEKKEVYSIVADLHFTISEIEKIEGFKDLSLANKKILFENIKRIVMEDVKQEALNRFIPPYVTKGYFSRSPKHLYRNTLEEVEYKVFQKLSKKGFPSYYPIMRKLIVELNSGTVQKEVFKPEDDDGIDMLKADPSDLHREYEAGLNKDGVELDEKKSINKDISIPDDFEKIVFGDIDKTSAEDGEDLAFKEEMQKRLFVIWSGMRSGNLVNRSWENEGNTTEAKEKSSEKLTDAGVKLAKFIEKIKNYLDIFPENPTNDQMDKIEDIISNLSGLINGSNVFLIEDNDNGKREKIKKVTVFYNSLNSDLQGLGLSGSDNVMSDQEMFKWLGGSGELPEMKSEEEELIGKKVESTYDTKKVEIAIEKIGSPKAKILLGGYFNSMNKAYSSKKIDDKEFVNLTEKLLVISKFIEGDSFPAKSTSGYESSKKKLVELIGNFRRDMGSLDGVVEEKVKK